MEIHLKIIGWLLIALTLLHIGFPRYFDWKNDLSNLSLINRQMMQIHTLFIALVLLLMGLMCVTAASDLINTNLGRTICIGLGFFWTVRLFIQFFGYATALWKGKRFETVMHVLFSLLWIYLSVVFWMIGLGK